MAAIFRMPLVAALLSLLAGVAALRPQAKRAENMTANSTSAVVPEPALASAKANSSWPWLAKSFEAALEVALDPVGRKLAEVKTFCEDQVAALKTAVDQADIDSKLEVFAVHVSEMLGRLKDKLQSVEEYLHVDSSKILAVKTILVTAGQLDLAKETMSVLTDIAEKVVFYEGVLTNSSALATELKALKGKAAPYLEKLEHYLQEGAIALSNFGSELQLKIASLMRSLANKLDVDESVFDPVGKSFDGSWRELETSGNVVSSGVRMTATSLPMEVTGPPVEEESGATTAKVPAKAIAATAVALTLWML